MDTKLTPAECNERNIDQCSDVACRADSVSVLGVLGASHERWPVVLEAVAEDGKNDSTKYRYNRTAAGCLLQEFEVRVDVAFQR